LMNNMQGSLVRVKEDMALMGRAMEVLENRLNQTENIHEHRFDRLESHLQGLEYKLNQILNFVSKPQSTHLNQSYILHVPNAFYSAPVMPQPMFRPLPVSNTCQQKQVTTQTLETLTLRSLFLDLLKDKLTFGKTLKEVCPGVLFHEVIKFDILNLIKPPGGPETKYAYDMYQVYTKMMFIIIRSFPRAEEMVAERGVLTLSVDGKIKLIQEAQALIPTINNSVECKIREVFEISLHIAIPMRVYTLAR
jgi:hypothetical protein